MRSSILSLIAFLLLPLQLCAGKPGQAIDDHGFPLPNGAIARLGDLRFANPGDISALALSPDECLIATARLGSPFTNGRIALWDTKSRKARREFLAPFSTEFLAFSREGRRLAAANAAGNVMMRKVANGTLAWKTTIHAARPNRFLSAMKLIDKDRLLAVALGGDCVQLLSARTGKLTETWRVDDKKKKELRRLGPEHQFVAVALSPSGETMAWLASLKNSRKKSKCAVFVYRTKTGKLLRRVEFEIPYAENLHLLDDGKRALLQMARYELPSNPASVKGTNIVVRLADGKALFDFHTRIKLMLSRPFGFRPTIAVLGIAPDGDSLFIQDEKGIRRWSLKSGKATGEWSDPWGRLAFSSDGKRIFVAKGMRIHCCDSQLRPLERSAALSFTPTVRFLSNRQLAAISRQEGKANVWDVKKRRIFESFRWNELPYSGRAPCSLDALNQTFVFHEKNGYTVFDLVKNRRVSRLANLQAENPWQARPWLSADGKRVLVYREIKNTMLVQWFDSESGRELGRCEIDAKEIFPQHFPPVDWYANDGSEFGYLSQDCCLVLIACADKRKRKIGIPVQLTFEKLQGANPQSVWNYEATEHGNLIVAAGVRDPQETHQQFVVWDRAIGDQLRHFSLEVQKGPSRCNRVFAPDGRTLAEHMHYSQDLVFYETATGKRIGQISLRKNWFENVTFAADGSQLAAGCSDTSVLIWNLNRPLKQLPPARSEIECAKLWETLASDDAERAHQAKWALVESPNHALALLRQELHPAKFAPKKRLQDLIAQLDSRSLREREKAENALVKLGELAVPALRAAQKKMTLEQLLRAERVLRRIQVPRASAQLVRDLRAIEVLERIGSTQAKQIVVRLAAGAPEALITREAQFVLRCWKKYRH